MLRCLLLAALVAFAMGAVLQYAVKEGEKVELNLGANIKVWERTVNGQKQTTRFCGPTEKNVACGKWVDKAGKPVASGAVVKSYGDLLIAKVTKADAGDYSSPNDTKGNQINVSVQ